jgi:hypothetical protein
VTNIETLQNVIRELHGVESSHRASVPVKETWQGETVWEGVIEVFDLHGHPKTNTAYAWSFQTDDAANPESHVTVLHIDPATSPLAALRAYLIQEYRNAKTA